MKQFLGIDINDNDAQKARVIILPVPYEATVSYGHGAARGPDAILAASAQVELYDTWFQREYPVSGICTLPLLEELDSYESMATSLKSRVVALLEQGRFPVIIGGEHSVAVPAVEAFALMVPDGLVVHVDAHADLRSQYEQNPNSHACALRRIRELKLRTVSIGIRSMSTEEAIHARQEKIIQCFPESPDFWSSISEALRSVDSRTWLTFDVDALDPSIMPATGTPEPGGLSWGDVMRLIQLFQESSIEFAGMDFVEFAPISGVHFPDFTAAKLLYRLILAIA